MTIPDQVFEETLKSHFSPIVPLLEDDTVTEIMINGPHEIYVERGGRLRLTGRRFETHHALMAALRNLSQYVGRELSRERPILEARLPDGSRVAAVIPPVSPRGPVVSVRRFSLRRRNVRDMVDAGALTEDAVDLLRALVRAKQNVIVSGGAGTGKTSILGLLASFVVPDERVVVIEDSTELQLPLPHVVELEAKPEDGRGRGGVTIRELLRATLRLRPDRVVIGEIRGAEALDLVQAMISGHRGSLSTIHASYPIDALHRLETMALTSDVGLPQRALRAQVASAVDAIVQTSRLSTGQRCVTHITEVLGYDQETGYRLAHRFVRQSARASESEA